MPYFDEPVGRVKIQTTSKNSQRYYTTKCLIRDLLSNTPNGCVRAGEFRGYLFYEEYIRWPTTVTAKYNSSRQNKICHGKIKFITAKYNLSRQNTIHHGKIQFITAKNNSKQQIQITPGKLQTLTAKAKTIIAIQNSSRQEQNAHGKSKSRMVVSG